MIAICLLLQACVRYIPNREEVNDDFDGRDPSAQSVGIEAFYQSDEDQRARLQELIDNRLNSIQKNNTLDYKIESGDKLRLHVRNFEEVNSEYEVKSNGHIVIPFVGRIKLAGKTEKEAKRLIKSNLVDYVVDPQVTIQVSEYATNRVWVFYPEGLGRTNNNQGSGRNQTSFPIRHQGYSLVELMLDIGQASLNNGGVLYLYPKAGLNPGKTNTKVTLDNLSLYCSAKNINKESLKCNETNPSEKQNLKIKYSPFSRITIDIEELFGGTTSEPLHVPLVAGDAVFFPTAPLIQVFGEVNRRGSYMAGNQGGGAGGGAAVKPTLFSVITAANGFTYSADIKNVEIYRNIEHGKNIVLSLDFEEVVQRKLQDIKLRDGDILWVPSAKSRFYENHTINGVNQFLGLGNQLQRSAN